MRRIRLAIAGLILLAGCSGGGGGDPAPVSTQSNAPPAQHPPITPPPPPPIQPDMLTATSQGLLRGKASGQGQQLIFSRTNLHQESVFISGAQVYYTREAPPVFLDFPNKDIWGVRTDGTGDHAVLNTGAHEDLRDANGSVALYEQTTYTLPDDVNPVAFGSLRDGAPTLLPIHERFTGYRFMRGDTAYFNNAQHIFSVNVNGSGLRTYATVLPTTTLTASDAFDNTLIYREFDLGTGRGTLRATPISGGPFVALDDGQSYVAYVGHVGSRVVSQRCVIDTSEFPPPAGPCDVVSVDANGSGLAVLASEPVNEAVQAVMGNNVIIRRNLSGNDQLIVVPVSGGPERLLMTMTDNEFVQLVAGDLLIVRRPSGTWSLDLNSRLTQLGTVPGDSGFVAVGNAVCLNKALAVWCMPLDGTSQVKIADTGRVVGVL